MAYLSQWKIIGYISAGRIVGWGNHCVMYPCAGMHMGKTRTDIDRQRSAITVMHLRPRWRRAPWALGLAQSLARKPRSSYRADGDCAFRPMSPARPPCHGRSVLAATALINNAAVCGQKMFLYIGYAAGCDSLISIFIWRNGCGPSGLLHADDAICQNYRWGPSAGLQGRV